MPYTIKELSASQSVVIFKALASDSRARIMELLAEREMNINELSGALGLAQPSTTKHIQILEEAGLVSSEYRSGPQGIQKLCRRVHERLLVEMAGITRPASSIAEVELPLGMFTDVQAVPTCGIATREKFVGLIDSPVSFYMLERSRAEILWSSGGTIEYAFANTLPLQAKATSIELAMEVGSEAPGYDNDFPSDITVWINGREIGTWCSPADAGGSRGRLNPSWWPDNMNQFGFLKVWHVDAHGASIDGRPLSAVTISDLAIHPWEVIRVRIGVKPDAAHQGGFTLFGRGFGNYEQDLVLRIEHTSRLGSPARSGVV